MDLGFLGEILREFGREFGKGLRLEERGERREFGKGEIRMREGGDEERELLGLCGFWSLWVDGQSRLSDVGGGWGWWGAGGVMKDGKLQECGFDAIEE